MKKMWFLSAVTIGILLVLIAPVFAPALKAYDAIWADGQIWDTVATPATFKAPNNPKSIDLLMVFDGSGLIGQRPVAEAAPYEKEYNGGRWFVCLIEFTSAGLAAHDGDDNGWVDFELTSFAEVLAHYNLGHFTLTPTNTYFVCPLVNFRG